MNQLVVTLIVILLPGIVATIVCDEIVVRQAKRDSFYFGVAAIVLGVLSYACLQLIVCAIDILIALGRGPIVWTELSVWGTSVSGNPTVPFGEVMAAVLLSIPIALVTAWGANNKWINKSAQWMRVSEKYGDENLYSYYLNAQEIDWVYVRDRPNNLTYQGRVFSFSENDKIQELVLSDVTVFTYDESKELYAVPTIYLSRESGQFTIEAVPPELLGEVRD